MALASAQDFIGYVRSGDVKSAKKFLSSNETNLNRIIQSTSSRAEVTFLMLACRHGHLEMIMLLIENGADVDFLTSSFPARSALMLAVEKRKLDVVKLLVHIGAQVMDATKGRRECALTIACEQGDLEIVKALLPKGPNSVNLIMSAEKWPVTNLCNQYGSIDYVKSPVSIAARKGHLELLSWLLNKGAEVPANSLLLAIYERNNSIANYDIIELLLKHGATVNETEMKMSALMMASCYGDIKIVKLLLSKGANANHKNEENYFALWIAAMEGHTEVVEILLEGVRMST